MVCWWVGSILLRLAERFGHNCCMGWCEGLDLQSKSCFCRALLPAKAAFQMQSPFRGAGWGWWIRQVWSSREYEVLGWWRVALPPPGHLGRKRVKKKWCPPALVYLRKFPPNPCPCGTCLQSSQWIFSYDPVAFQTAVSSLRLGESEFVHKPFKSGVSVSLSLLALPTALLVFKAWCYGSSSSWYSSPKSGAWYVAKTLHSSGGPLWLWYPSWF